MDQQRREVVVHLLVWWLSVIQAMRRMFITMLFGVALSSRRRIRDKSYTLNFHAKRAQLRAMVYNSDNTCYNQIRMYRVTFDRLCHMLGEIGGLKPSKHMLVDEQVAMFLHILAHHVKNRVIQLVFGRSGETIHRYFHLVLNALMHLHKELYKTPEPIPEDSTDERWKWFKNCLGALDGTHIRIHVQSEDKGRYRNRKGEITTNVLGVCSQDAQFVYVLPGWEGSAADGRVLRDAISRRHGLKVPQGCYYLVDAGYTNCDGFLAPYRGQRYHLNEWRDGRMPQTPRECFNMRHSAARNVIERCFGILKKRWAILRSPTFYPVKTHNRVIIACCLLHNLIRRENIVDPLEEEFDEAEATDSHVEVNPILTMETSDAWSNWRETLANDMFDAFRAHRGNR